MQKTLPPTTEDVTTYLTTRYSSGIFMGILVDTGAAVRSTAGLNQFQALQRVQRVPLNTSTAGQAKIMFGIGETSSLGTADVKTPIGTVTFHIVPADVLFLLCLEDIDKLNVKFDNLDNVLI
jgi:hypothetical protein